MIGRTGSLPSTSLSVSSEESNGTNGNREGGGTVPGPMFSGNMLRGLQKGVWRLREERGCFRGRWEVLLANGRTWLLSGDMLDEDGG